MKIEVLGCSGAEYPGHYPPGFLVDKTLLLDAGTLNNVLDEKDQLRIENIFITHAHLDHIREIPFLADNLIIGGRKHKVKIFSIPPVIKDIKNNLLNSRLWPDMTVLPNPDDAVVSLITLKAEKSYPTDHHTVTPYKVNHSVPAVGYLVEDQRERRLFYTGDTGPTDATWRRLGKKQIHCLIIEVSFPNRMEEIAITTGHLTPALLKAELLKIAIPPERIYITHLKPQFYRTIKMELQKVRVKNLSLLKEGQIIRV